MGEVPTTTNQLAGTVEAIINGATMKVAAPLLINLISSTPYTAWLKWPIISGLFSMLVNYFMAKLAWVFEVIGVRLVIKIQTDQEESAYSQAEEDLRKAQLSGDQNAIQKSSDQFDKTLGNLIHWDGSAPVQ